MIDVISGSTTKPASSKKLAEILQAAGELRGTLYVGYPILGTPEGASHRLSFFPSPNLEIYEQATEAYEADEIYADIVNRNAIRFPIRFDFSSDAAIHVDMNHPKSHLTLGQYSGCRIPVNSPLTPTKFMSFILRSFYNPAFNRVNFSDDAIRLTFPETITNNEKKIGFFSC